MLIEHKNKSQENPDKMENYLSNTPTPQNPDEMENYLNNTPTPPRPNQAQKLKQEPGLDLSSGSSSDLSRTHSSSPLSCSRRPSRQPGWGWRWSGSAPDCVAKISASLFSFPSPCLSYLSPQRLNSCQLQSDQGSHFLRTTHHTSMHIQAVL